MDIMLLSRSTDCFGTETAPKTEILSQQHHASGENWASLYVPLDGDINAGDTLAVTVSGTPDTNIYAEFKNPSDDPNLPEY